MSEHPSSYRHQGKIEIVPPIGPSTILAIDQSLFVQRVRLTKKLLISLTEHHWIATNTVPSRIERVAPLIEREAQWQRFREGLHAGRLCSIYDGSTPRKPREPDHIIQRIKFTKETLMDLKEGLIVQITSGRFYKETVVPLAEREEQWERFKAAEGAGMMCYILDQNSNTSFNFITGEVRPVDDPDRN
jgi:hypothetical protein